MNFLKSIAQLFGLSSEVAASHVDRATANLAAENPQEALRLLRAEHGEKISILTEKLQGLKSFLQQEATDVIRVQGEANKFVAAIKALKEQGKPDDHPTVAELASQLAEKLTTLDRERDEEVTAQGAVSAMEQDIATIGARFHEQVEAVERQLAAHQGAEARLEIAKIQANMAQEVAGISTSFASTIEEGLKKSQAGMAQEVAGLNAKAAHLRDGADPNRGMSREAHAALEAAAKPRKMSIEELLAKATATKK